MNIQVRFRPIPTLAVCCALASALALPLHAADKRRIDAALDTQVATDRSARKSQQKIDGLADDSTRLLDEYRSATREIDRLQADLARRQKAVEAQRVRLAELERQLDEVEAAQPLLLPLAERMVASLARFVELDVPFLDIERRERVAHLRALAGSADAPLAERFRRVLDALRVEVEYGHSIEAYRGELTTTDANRSVEFLRVGRIGLYAQVPDGGEGYVWDQQARTWQPLSAGERRRVDEALRFARKESAPALLVLPVNAAGARP
jgi:septal ring factor EnvC (AmiA/AmiB activator)